MTKKQLLEIKVTVRDPDVLARVSPAAMARYLEARGWRQKKGLRWAVKGFEVLVPDRSSYLDYALRISNLLDALGKIENRSELAILSDLL